jgi:hypothetical protein
VRRIFALSTDFSRYRGVAHAARARFKANVTSARFAECVVTAIAVSLDHWEAQAKRAAIFLQRKARTSSTRNTRYDNASAASVVAKAIKPCCQKG